MSVKADIAEVSQPLPPSPITQQDLEQLLTQSVVLKNQGIKFTLQAPASSN